MDETIDSVVLFHDQKHKRPLLVPVSTLKYKAKQDNNDTAKVELAERAKKKNAMKVIARMTMISNNICIGNNKSEKSVDQHSDVRRLIYTVCYLLCT